MNPFEFVNAINTTKVDLIRTGQASEQSYNTWVINKALSYHIDTIMYASQINGVSHIDPILQNDYYLNTVRSGKRYSKWHKKEQSEDIEAIKEYYQTSYIRAQEIKQVLTRDQLDLIKIRIIKGGNDAQSKSNGGGETS